MKAPYGMRERLAVALVAVFANALPALADIAADDDDILDGQQYLVRSDDLLVADPGFVSGSTDKTKVQYFPLDTEDMEITTSESVAATKLLEPSCTASSKTNTPFPQQTQTMRLFNLPNDVILTFAPTKGVTGSGCENQSAGAMTFYVQDPVAGTQHKFVASGDIRNRWLHTAVADFDGDGFDDLFITTDEWIYVATANDTDSLADGVAIVASLKLGSSATAMNDPTIGDFNADGNLDVAWMGAGFSDGNLPSVKFATICTGPIDNTVCEGKNSFDILTSEETIAPTPNDDTGTSIGALVTVGGKCTENDNNQIGSELRAPAMAVAGGQFDDTTAGDELLVVYLYEHDKNNNCHVMAEVYSFAQFSASETTLSAKFERRADNIASHDHISNPSAIYAQGGNLDWSSSKEQVPVAMSGGTNHTVLVISFAADLSMALERHEFDTSHDKSFAGLAVGRFSSAPSADTSTCSQDSDCPDTCTKNVCEISGFSCSTDGDCQGACTSDGVCSYVKPNNYNLQFAAFLMARSTDHSSDVYIYTADPVDAFTPKKIQEFSVDNFVTTATKKAIRAGSLLRAGDLEGRSQRLGTPTVVRITSNLQPDLILSAPPMHADWLGFGELDETQFCDPTPTDCPASFSADNPCNCTDLASNSTCSDGSELRCLINFSTLTSFYNSGYTFTDADSHQQSRTDTTSWSLGLSTDLSEKTKSLTPTGIQITQEVSFATENTYNHSVATTNSSYETEDSDASTTTGFYDHLWFTQRDYNVYYYPVIGQTICVDSCQQQSQGQCSISGDTCADDSDCPDGESCDPGRCSISGDRCADDSDCPDTGAETCSDADMQQLYVQYDGATSVSPTALDGGKVEWYQPVEEPGQVFSYPWDCDQLASRNDVNICDDSADDYTLLSKATAFATDTSTDQYSMTWDVGSGTSRTAGKGGQFSQKLTETVTASTPQLESQVEGVKLKESVSVNANEAISTSKTNSTTLDSSTGITVARPGTFLTPGKFSYSVQGYIFGDAPKPGQLDTYSPETPTDIVTNGVIRSAFTANPRNDGGSWWKSGPYNQYIDVALNRPSHLVTITGKGASDPAVTNCLPESTQVAVTDDCVDYVLPDPSPAGLYNSQFYWLRGFFITPADAIGQGPQLYQADEGDILGLQTRVYNYSLQDMNTGSIKVDFYAQEWDTQCQTPAGYYDHDQSCTQPGGAIVSCEDSCDPCCIANTPADSIWLGQDELDPLPGFNAPASPELPNWELATTTFDTGDPSVCGSGGCGDKDYMFWVIAWPEGTDNDANPAMLAELPGHSLTRIPPVLTSIADVCPLDNDCLNGACRATGTSCATTADCETAADNSCGRDSTCAVSGTACSTDADCGDCLCELCMGRFSNNVAFYHQPIAINAEATEASLRVAALPVGAGVGVVQGKVALERISVTPVTAEVGDQVIVRAGLRAVDARVDGHTVHFYAVPHDMLPLPRVLKPGHPKVKKAFDRFIAFDQEILARIRAGRVHEAHAPFFPPEPGEYRILVSGIIDGEERLLGDAELQVIEPARVLICHKGREIHVGESAVPAHLAHGDKEGACKRTRPKRKRDR